MANHPIQWETVNAAPALGDREVHLWRVQSPLEAKSAGQAASFLSSAEVARAKRFYFERDRIRFSHFRGFLRYLLGQYLQRDPKAIAFQENAQGKPRLAEASAPVPLHFNLAHSHDTALLAFSPQGPLGVDVEKLQEPYEGEKIAGRYFTPEELSYLQSLPAAERARGFFRLWTLKEAYLKALGLGFQGGLDSFSILPLDQGQARLQGRHPLDSQGSWHLDFFELTGNFLGALVAPRGIQSIRYLIAECRPSSPEPPHKSHR